MTTDRPAPAQPVSLQPAVTVTNGTPEEEAVVELAVARFVETGLALPDLELRVLDTCSGGQGRYIAEEAVIELCVINEFLVLHELAHAWEHFQLTDGERRDFVDTTPTAQTWRASSTEWKNRGIEIMANSIATALLARPLPAGSGDDTELAHFEAVTGSASPRLALPREALVTWTTADIEDNADSQAAYAGWRRSQAG